MIADVRDYNTRSSENRNLYVPKCNNERSFAYQCSTLWNDLPNEVKECGPLEGFKLNYRFYIQLIVFSYQVILNMAFTYSINLPIDILNDIHVFSPSVKCTN